jgi:hypothetical protein
MSKRFLTAVVAVAFALPALAERHFLLRDSFANPGRARAEQAKAKRRRNVEPDFSALATNLNRGQKKKQERLLTVQLFPDTTLSVVLDSVEKNDLDTIVWTGVVEGAPLSSVIIATKGDAMTATFSTLENLYTVQPMPGQLHEVVEIDRAGFPEELQPQQVQMATAPANRVAADAIGTNDAPGTWDVLIAYTTNLRNAYGSVAAVETLIANAVAATNTSYANSSVTSRMRLAGTMEVTYADTSNGFSQALSHLRGTSDGNMDEVHAQRNTVGADAVSLLILGATDNACGIGYVMSTPSANFATNAFNVTRYDCAVGNLSFAHEFGHNFGLQHDRLNSGGGTGSYTYAFGYQNPNGLFRDVMAYANGCPGNCPRIQYFSNPDVLYNGNPTGVNYLASDSADNARALNNNANYIANWRQAPVVVTPVTFTDDPLVAGTTLVKAVHLTELRTAINNKRVAAGLTANSSWSSVAVGDVIAVSHILELRNALTPALSSSPSFSSIGGSILAAHVQELRELTR